MKFKQLLTLIILLYISLPLYAQHLYLDGIISGYSYNPSKGLFKKGNDVSLEGRLNNVTIDITDINNNKILFTKTNSKGEFHIELPLGKEYWLKASKKEHGDISFKIDLTQGQQIKNLNFWSLELILNSYKYKKANQKISECGLLGVNSNGFYFKEYEQKTTVFSKKNDYSPLVSLIQKSISNNKSKIYIDKQNPENKEQNIPTVLNNNTKTKKVHHTLDDTVKDEEQSFEFYNSEIYNGLLNNKLDLFNKELQIRKAKEQYEIDRLNAKTPLDSLLIEGRGKLIFAAENELIHLKKIISQKENELDLKNKQLILVFIALFLVFIMVYFILRAYKIKTKLNSKLKDSNKKILDSINYAVKIQDAILPKRNALKQHIDSFILFKPKDKVSGDYYWFEEVNNKIIIAAVDCTGHGVPGAFMSMIGNILMNTIILESNITSPKEILISLNTELKNSLNQDNTDPFSSQDGMDMSICVIDKTNKNLTYAGAMNPIFLVKNGEIDILEVTKKGVGGFDLFKGKQPFTESTITLDTGTQLYLLSDGFMDQFGGENNEKFNLKRFTELLKQCDSQPMEKQYSLFETTFEDWKGSNEQTDDVLVIGINL
jgi:serine phosphatase RsbU (regulator of sigma subunit)